MCTSVGKTLRVPAESAKVCRVCSGSWIADTVSGKEKVQVEDEDVAVTNEAPAVRVHTPGQVYVVAPTQVGKGAEVMKVGGFTARHGVSFLKVVKTLPNQWGATTMLAATDTQHVKQIFKMGREEQAHVVPPSSERERVLPGLLNLYIAYRENKDVSREI